MIELNPLNHPICFAVPKRLTPYSAWREHIPFAMFLIDILRPRLLVELGTYYGDSYCAFCQAIKELHLDSACFAVDSWEGDIHHGHYGDEVLADLRAHHDPLYSSMSQLIKSSFDDALPKFSDDTIDLLHIDGTHVYEAVKHDFETWLPKVKNGGIILFHDTNMLEPPYGVWRLWNEIKNHYPHFEFTHCYGLGVLFKGENPPKELATLLSAKVGEAEAIRSLFSRLGYRYSSDILTAQINIQRLSGEVERLKEDIKASNTGIVMQILRRYQKFLDILLPTGTLRRSLYNLPLDGIRIILNKGWRAFFHRSWEFITRKKVN